MSDGTYKPGDRYREKDTTDSVTTDQLADAYLQLAAQVDHLSARLQKSEAKILSISRLETALSAHLSAMNRSSAREQPASQLPPPPAEQPFPPPQNAHVPPPPAQPVPPPQNGHTMPPPEMEPPSSGERINLGHPDTMRNVARETEFVEEDYYAPEPPPTAPRAPRKRAKRKRKKRSNAALIASLVILGLFAVLAAGGVLAYNLGALDSLTQVSQGAAEPPANEAALQPPPAPPAKEQEKKSDPAKEEQSKQKVAALAPAAIPLPATSEPSNTASVSEPEPAKPQAVSEDLPVGVFPKGMREAAISGDPTAQYLVARHFHEGKIVPQNDGNAAIWIKKAAAQDYPPAVYRLAAMHERGRGVNKDLPRAFELYQQAAGDEHIVAMYNLSVFYLSDKIGKKDLKKSAYWLQQAAQYGLPNAQFNLARFYQTGNGVEKDLSQALYWYFLAAGRGDKEAQNQIKAISQQMDPAEYERVLDRAKQWRPIPPNYYANALQPPKKTSGISTPTNSAGDASASSVAQPTQSAQTGFDVTPDVVREVQSVLIATGYLTGSADGVAGPKTKDAIKAFQADKGLPATGEIYKDFFEALKNQPG